MAAASHGLGCGCELIFGNLVIAKRGNRVVCVCAQRRVALRNLANASCLRESCAAGWLKGRLVVEQTPKGESFFCSDNAAGQLLISGCELRCEACGWEAVTARQKQKWSSY